MMAFRHPRLLGWRLATAWSVVAALLFHVTILLAPNFTHAADGLGNNVIVCSSFGQYTIAHADLDGDQLPAKGSAPEGSFFCPICSTAQFLGAALPSFETILPPSNRSVERVLFARADLGGSILIVAGSGPRAPPKIV